MYDPITELQYRNYKFNRDQGVSAERLALVVNEDIVAKFERRYLAARQQAALNAALDDQRSLAEYLRRRRDGELEPGEPEHPALTAIRATKEN